jgi:hypothetical protein
MGPQVDGLRDLLCPMDDNQVVSPLRFYRRIDRDPNGTDASEEKYWIMYFDGSLMKEGAGGGLVFVSPLENSCGTLFDSTSKPPTTWQNMRPS